MGYRHSQDDLLEAAVDVALLNGIGALTFASVGGSLGISDRTVVYYYPSKARLVTAVVNDLGGRLQSLLEVAFGQAPLSPDDLVQRAWPVLASPRADPIFAIFFEVVGLGSAGKEPYASLAPELIESWVEWLEPHVLVRSPSRRRAAALAIVAQLDGLLLLRHAASPRASNSAAVELGIIR